MEKEERKFYREVKKEAEKREEEEIKKRQKKEETSRNIEEFLKKFFPDCRNSPGGTQKLVNNNPNSARITGVGKMKIKFPESLLDILVIIYFLDLI